MTLNLSDPHTINNVNETSENAHIWKDLNCLVGAGQQGELDKSLTQMSFFYIFFYLFIHIFIFPAFTLVISSTKQKNRKK